jgi:GNAT superfamily N-acetyltransferase
MSNFVIRKATKVDLDAIKAIADAHRNELGFVLRPALARSILREEVLVAQNGSGPIGFVEYHHRRDKQTTLYHIAVNSEHRQLGIGKALIDALRSEALALGKETIRLKCPADLPTRSFYEHIGFRSTGIESGKNRSLAIFTLII